MSDLIATACYRELGAELRRLREAAGLTGAELAHKIGWTTTRVSRCELGYVHLNEVDLITYLGFCGVFGAYGNEWRAMCREAEPKPGYWLRRHELGLPEGAYSLIYHESTASASTSYEPEFVPGLLQTEAYIRAMVAERLPNSDVELAVRIRKERQQNLRRPVPCNFTFFIHEKALRLVVGNPAVMHEQMLTLLLLDGLSHVAIRVVPAAAGVQAILEGSFRLFEYANHPPLVYLDGLTCGMFLEDREYVDDYRALLPDIANLALNEGQSREWLAALASAYDREGANPDARDGVEEKHL